EKGLIIAYDKLHPVELATSSFGQSMNVTMVQMAAGFSSLVNGGYYYQPHMVKQIINDKGATVKNFDPVLERQTVSKKTSDFIQNAMYQTVEGGTAKGAKVEGYAVGGKTGTAQKYPREAKTYLVSFIGAVPAVNPEVVIYVIIDEPQKVPRQANSGIATQFASGILKEILPALDIFPTGDIDYLLPAEDTSATGNAGQTTADATSSQGSNTQTGTAGNTTNNTTVNSTGNVTGNTTGNTTGNNQQNNTAGTTAAQNADNQSSTGQSNNKNNNQNGSDPNNINQNNTNSQTATGDGTSQTNTGPQDGQQIMESPTD
ncbi:MAG TPA: penicillin-binding transpeptidase domain-containing protein, partial [Mobilitalea sp.]|nr:penicillin-binding transpeptidase domain-containing protein [Mobilitalea sp.]